MKWLRLLRFLLRSVLAVLAYGLSMTARLGHWGDFRYRQGHSSLAPFLGQPCGTRDSASPWSANCSNAVSYCYGNSCIFAPSNPHTHKGGAQICCPGCPPSVQLLSAGTASFWCKLRPKVLLSQSVLPRWQEFWAYTIAALRKLDGWKLKCLKGISAVRLGFVGLGTSILPESRLTSLNLLNQWKDQI